MSANGKQNQFRLGFLMAIEVAEHGFMGGLLVTNHQGRPLEFQCTTPVKPNRTQQILYGPTLEPFLLGELIGRTLVQKIGVKPHLILAEQREILELRQHIDVPVACLADEDNSAPATSADSARSPLQSAQGVGTPGGDEFVILGRQRLRFHHSHPADRSLIQQHAGTVPRDADLREPFQRIREALNEAMQSGTTR